LADKVVQYFAGFMLTPALRKQLADAGISLQQLRPVRVPRSRQKHLQR
ncbi:MAG: hypothetical protein RLY92_595, partial [Chloroflexota bacterium]